MAKPNLPQFDREYDQYKMRQFVDEINRWAQNIQEGGSSSGGGGVGTTVHNDLSGRAAPDAHPISAITNLTAELLAKASQADLDILNLIVADHEVRITTLELGADGVALASRYDETVAATVLYFGEANPGAADADPVWRIQRITLITPGEDDSETEWADGVSDFTKIWDDRLGLSYS